MIPLAVWLLLGAAGCTHISYDTDHEFWENELLIVSEKKPKNEELLISISIDGHALDSLSRIDEKTMVACLLEDGPFLVSWDLREPADLKADLTIGKLQESHNLFWHYLTLGIVPTYKDVRLRLRLVFRDDSGRQQLVYKGEKDYQEWRSLLYTLFPPSWAAMDEDKQVDRESSPMKDMMRDLVRKMYEEDYEFFRDFGK